MVPSDLPGTPSLDLEKHHTKGTPVTTEERQGSTRYSATLSLPEQDKDVLVLYEIKKSTPRNL